MSAPAMRLAALSAVVGALGLACATLAHSYCALAPTSLLAAIAVAVFVTTRHAQLVRRRRARRWPGTPPPPPGELPPRGQRAAAAAVPDYYLFVLGSGGHTKEMLMMMDDGFCDFGAFHRRYLLSSGDAMSRHHVDDYEARLRGLCRAAGTEPGCHDRRTVTRARRVHQPLLTTPLTALVSLVDILCVLLSPPRNAVGRRLPYPTHVFSNGPATGFFVALAIHLLKLFCVVPEDVMRFVYIEFWARISTLSLTGKLLLRTGLADAFYVQHRAVAARYGLACAGEMVFNSRRLAE